MSTSSAGSHGPALPASSGEGHGATTAASAAERTGRARVLRAVGAVLTLWLPFAVVAWYAPSLQEWILQSCAVLPGVPIAMHVLGVDDSNRWATGSVTLALVAIVGALAVRRPKLAAAVGLLVGSFVALWTYGLSRV